MHVRRRTAEFQRESRCHHHLRRRCDVGELRVHLRTDVFEGQLENRLPRLRVFVEDDAEQALNDALLGRREIATLDPGMEAPVAAEEIVDDEKDEVGVEDDQGGAAQGLGDDQVEVGRDDQIADELAVFLDTDRATEISALRCM